MTASDSPETSSTEDLLLDDSDFDENALLAVLTGCAATEGYFCHDEMDDQGHNYVDPDAGVRYVLLTLQHTPDLFKSITNLTAVEFELLSTLVCPLIMMTARTTGKQRSLFGRLPKLSPQQRLLHFLLYLKHDNASRYEGFVWNWSKSSSCDDALFVASCINEALQDQLCWPNEHDRRMLGSRIPELPGCIGFIDETLVEICRPHNNPQHGRWFNGRKKIYSLNNTVVVDHDGLFIFLDAGYPGSFHDVNILR